MPQIKDGTSAHSNDNEKAIYTYEQKIVDHLYSIRDTQERTYGERLTHIRKQSGQDSPGEMSERDSFATHYEDALLRLKNTENRMVLGSMTFADNTTHHVGRIGLVDDNHDVALLDWRAAQARPFYQATPNNNCGLISRRHIGTLRRKVTHIDDELLDTSAEVTNLHLTGEGALLSSLKQARTGQMSDIVATIQKEQDTIIRAPMGGCIVVQGGPGTGKTAVALHRAAYLMYEQKERLARSGVLIIGPSQSFIRYINNVLPSLGENNVVSTTLDNLVPGYSASTSDTDELKEIKGRKIWRSICRETVGHILKKPLEKTVTLTINGIDVQLTPQLIRQAQEKAHASNKKHNQAYVVYAQFLVNHIAHIIAEEQKTTIEDSPWIIQDITSDIDARREINIRWLPSSPLHILERLYAHPHLLKKVAPDLTEDERRALYRPKGSPLTRGDIAILDEFAELLGPFESQEEKIKKAHKQKEKKELHSYINQTLHSMNVGGGIVNADMLYERLSVSSGNSLSQQAQRDRSWTYGHIVVDEAQELTYMEWEMLIRRCPSRSMTIVGDVDQKPQGAPQGGWASLIGRLAHNTTIYTLHTSYRTPQTILEHAYRALHHAGHTPESLHAARNEEDCYTTIHSTSNNIPHTIERELHQAHQRLRAIHGEDIGTIGVITPHNFPLNQEVRERINANTGPISISLLTSEESKGLEFDDVILIEPAQLLREGPGHLYVALTRPTHHITVIYSDILPQGLE